MIDIYLIHLLHSKIRIAMRPTSTTGTAMANGIMTSSVKKQSLIKFITKLLTKIC